MNYCYNCGHITPGEPLYCNYCGRSYDLKLCPRHHPNPRSADVCSKCGSRELSTPQPKVPAMWKHSANVIRLGLGLLLLYVTLSFFIDLARTTQFQQALVCFGLLLTGTMACLGSESSRTGFRTPCLATFVKAQEEDDAD